ncbi:MAG TPA: head GIN domain-containing protein [Casimicrobiaceae bacterium]|nr:head GIN domain-containing protein [Casimicrobiaceae bacterium]
MRRALLPFALLAAVVVALALAWAVLHDGRDGGSGDRAPAQSIEVGAFRGVEVDGHAEIILVQGEAEKVDVEAGSRGAARVRVRAREGTLSISAAPEGPWWRGLLGGGTGRPPLITIHFRTLESLALSGAVRVTAEAMKVPELRVRASGAASVRLDGMDAKTFRFAASGAVKGEVAGRAEQQDVSISGAGDYRAAGLVSDTADVKVSGAGRVTVNARRALDASISGAGAIDYLGHPQVRQSISGAGRIRQVTRGDPVRPGGLPLGFQPVALARVGGTGLIDACLRPPRPLLPA